MCTEKWKENARLQTKGIYRETALLVKVCNKKNFNIVLRKVLTPSDAGSSKERKKHEIYILSEMKACAWKI